MIRRSVRVPFFVVLSLWFIGTQSESQKSASKISYYDRILENIHNLSFSGVRNDGHYPEVDYLAYFENKDMLMSSDEATGKSHVPKRPTVASGCKNEVFCANLTTLLPPEKILGGLTMDYPQNKTIDPTILSQINLRNVRPLELHEITQCRNLALPQLIDLIENDKLRYVHDACISTMSPHLFSYLSAEQLDMFAECKPAHVKTFWRYFHPSSTARSEWVKTYIFQDPSLSFLCCKQTPEDFDHANNLKCATDGCLANIFEESKCSAIKPDFFTQGPQSPQQPLFNNTSIKSNGGSVSTSSGNKKQRKSSTMSSEEFTSLVARIIRMITPTGFKNMPDETKMAIWNSPYRDFLGSDVCTRETIYRMDYMVMMSRFKENKA